VNREDSFSLRARGLLPASGDRGWTRGYQSIGSGIAEGGGEQSGMGNGRVLSAQLVFIGTSGSSWSVSGGEDGDLVPRCGSWGEQSQGH
jgi:hypothetical protein